MPFTYRPIISLIDDILDFKVELMGLLFGSTSGFMESCHEHPNTGDSSIE
jgi:hypothetical protein